MHSLLVQPQQEYFGRVKIPAMGVFSTEDLFLNEKQVIDSAAFIDATWQYERLDNISPWPPIDEPGKSAEIIIQFHKIRD
jgi:hypothetical protein